MQKAMLLAAAAALVVVGTADARQPSKTGTPAQVQRLMDCRNITAPDQRLACYDREVAAMNQAIASNDLVLIDKEKARAAGRSLFGFSIPNFGGLFGTNGELNQIDGTIKSIAHNQDGGWVITLEDGSIWSQTDDWPGFRCAPRQEDHRQAWNPWELLADERPEWDQGEEDRLAAASSLLRLQACLCVDIRLLAFDAPVSEVVKRNARAGDRADHMIPVAQQPEGSRRDSEFERPCRFLT